MTTNRLHSAHVQLRYHGAAVPVVHDLTIDVADGAITSIIGPNGCGKSTLLRALGRLLKPSGGAVILDGQVIQELPTKEVARRLGLLHQTASAPEGITVEDLVRRGRYPHQGFLQPPAKRDLKAVERALELSGMTELRERGVDTLSGGQRQRAWIAMVLAQETDLLLLDEPTTFLDVAHQIEVMDLVKRLNAEGRTVLMVLHDVNEAARVSDRIVAMRDGRIVREGPPAEVIEPGLLHALYGVECDVVVHPSEGFPIAIPRSAPEVGARRAEPRPGGIEVRGLGTGYQKQMRVSDSLTLDIPAGLITSIVGPNACGKSTLLRTGARLLKPFAGTFCIDGHESRRRSRRRLARELAMVMQGPKPPPGFLVEDVVAAGRMCHQGFLRQWSRDDSEIIASALERCGLADLRYRELDTLSGGQRQRVWIAMALAQDTPFLFLDEPTTFLDVGYQIEVLDLVHRLNREEGRTVVMVLHDLNFAARYSDLIIAMKDGEIVASGAPAEVITEATVRDVFAVESRVVIDPRTGAPLVLPTPGAPVPATPGAAALTGDRRTVATLERAPATH